MELNVSKFFNTSDFKLCYVEHNFAYFTSKTDIKAQCGDDWNDAPYEHNAGTPYQPSRPDLENRIELFPDDWNADGTPKWEVVKIAFSANLETPADLANSNSVYSVEQINIGSIAWLSPSKYGGIKNPIPIFANTTIFDFIEKIRQNEGEVYIPISWIS